MTLDQPGADPSRGHTPAALFLFELMLQCSVARYSYTLLSEAALAWGDYQPERSIREKENKPAIFAAASSFLSAAGVISKLLYVWPGRSIPKEKRSGVVARTEALRRWMGLSEQPLLEHIGTRNALEHMDEELDKRLRDFRSGTFQVLAVSSEPPPPGSTVLRCFDPETMTLTIAGVTMDMRVCMDEIEHVQIALAPAFARLAAAPLDLWSGAKP